MKRLAIGLYILAFICALITVSVSVKKEVRPDGQTLDLRIGFTPSPWFHHHSAPGERSSGIDLWTWSTLIALVGAEAFVAARRLQGQSSEA